MVLAFRLTILGAAARIGEEVAPYSPASHRGNFSEITFGDGKISSVGKFIDLCNDCIGKEFTGWKGGEFRMTSSTLVYRGDYGSGGLEGIDGIDVTTNECLVYISDMGSW